MSNNAKTGSENGKRMIYDVGMIEHPKQKAKIKSRMFEFNCMKKRGKK